MTAIDIRTALMAIAAEIERGNHRSAQRQIGKLIDSLPPATVGELLSTNLKKFRDGAVVIEFFDGDFIGQFIYLEDIIDRCVGGEHQQSAHRYCAYRVFDEQWNDDGFHRMDMLVDALNYPARLVPAYQADADPATRGPIGGGR